MVPMICTCRDQMQRSLHVRPCNSIKTTWAPHARSTMPPSNSQKPNLPPYQRRPQSRQSYREISFRVAVGLALALSLWPIHFVEQDRKKTPPGHQKLWIRLLSQCRTICRPRVGRFDSTSMRHQSPNIAATRNRRRAWPWVYWYTGCRVRGTALLVTDLNTSCRSG